MDWLDLLAVQGTLKSLLQHHSSKASILLRSAFFTVQLSHPYMTTGKTIALTRWTFVGKVKSLLFNILSRLEKEMATHCSVLAWRIPGTGEPHGLPSMGSHRVGHDWATGLTDTYMGNSGNSVKFYFWGSKITEDGDCSYEIKRHLLLGRKAMKNLVYVCAKLLPTLWFHWL